MKLKYLPLVFVTLMGCEGSTGKFSSRESAYNQSLECYQSNDDSKLCQSAYDALIEYERSSIEDREVEDYKQKYCAGLNMDQLLCEVGRTITLIIEQEEKEKANAKIEHYLANRTELQSKYNECGEAYYEKAGLKRDGTWIGAFGSSKLHKAQQLFSDDFNWECRVAADAANKLNIEYALYFVETL